VVEPALDTELADPAGVLFLSTRGGQAWIAREQDGEVLVDRARVSGGELVFFRVEPILLEPGPNALTLSVATDSGETLRERITISLDAECTRAEHCQAGDCFRYRCQT